MNHLEEVKIFSNALVDAAIIIGASISGNWWLLFLLLLTSLGEE